MIRDDSFIFYLILVEVVYDRRGWKDTRLSILTPTSVVYVMSCSQPAPAVGPKSLQAPPSSRFGVPLILPHQRGVDGVSRWVAPTTKLLD